MIDDVPQNNFQPAATRKRRLSAIWLIPIIAAFLAMYLGWHSYAQHGPDIRIGFKTARDIVIGQTQIRYKAVTLGTVDNVTLNKDKTGVTVTARMTSSAEPLLTANTRFWVVRPHLNGFNVSDLETLVSGSYIQLEPGEEGAEQRDFTGLENPPIDGRDEKGRNFVLHTDNLGSLTIGSPVYYRGVEAGSILGYDLGNGFDPIAITVFIRAPYDQYVHDHSEFWDASGLSLNIGPGGVQLTTHALRSVLSGGVSFSTPVAAEKEAEAASGTVFPLYGSEGEADVAHYRLHLPYAVYYKTSVKDLGKGSPVMLYGIQVGEVTEVRLVLDAATHDPKVRVAFELQPDRAFLPSTATDDPAQIIRQLVDKGLRVKIDSGNLVFGNKMLNLEFAPNAPPAQISEENGVTVLPGQGDQTGNLLDALSDVSGKLNQIPFEQIGNNLNHLLANANNMVGGADMQKTMRDLSVTMANAADLTKKADQNLTPTLQKLPEISRQLQDAVAHANGLMSGLDHGYGEGSDFERDSKRTLNQVNDAARSIRLLADFLERHPEALISGKQPAEAEDKP